MEKKIYLYMYHFYHIFFYYCLTTVAATHFIDEPHYASLITLKMPIIIIFILLLIKCGLGGKG